MRQQMEDYGFTFHPNNFISDEANPIRNAVELCFGEDALRWNHILKTYQIFNQKLGLLKRVSSTGVPQFASVECLIN